MKRISLQPLPVVNLFLLFSFLTIQCASPTSPRDEGLTAADFSTPDEAVVYLQNRFGLKLFSAVNASEKEADNLFISPLSVSMALGMAMNGASGQTRNAMEQTLGFTGLSEEAINESYRSLIGLLIGLDSTVDLRIANSIWYRDSFQISPTFVDVNQTYFDAVVKGLDFNKQETVQIINDWVNENTNGLIPRILDEPIDPLTMMLLLNAIYFKGEWTQKFPRSLTEDRAFHLPDHSTDQVPTMKLIDVDLPYYYDHDNHFQAVDLAYGDSLFSMTVILPDEGRDIDSFVGRLDQAIWDSCISKLAPRHIIALTLPKFKIEYSTTLNDILRSKGMGIAFDPGRADFSRMTADSSGGLFIDKVKHAAYVDVYEEGTEAAASTIVMVGTTYVEGVSVYIDRPFVFAIRERQTGTILFIGKVENPSVQQ